MLEYCLQQIERFGTPKNICLVTFIIWKFKSSQSLLGIELLKTKGNSCTFKTYFQFHVYLGNDHLIEFQLIEIVFYHLIEIMLITWPNFLTLFTWSNYSINWLKRTDGFWQLIEILKSLKYHIRTFDQLPKKNWWILAVDRNFLN